MANKWCNKGSCEKQIEPSNLCCVQCPYKDSCSEMCEYLNKDDECMVGEQVEDD